MPTTMWLALLQRARLAADFHAADAGDDVAAGVLVQPVELARDLEREFARRRDDERERLGGTGQARGSSPSSVGAIARP